MFYLQKLQQSLQISQIKLPFHVPRRRGNKRPIGQRGAPIYRLARNVALSPQKFIDFGFLFGQAERQPFGKHLMVTMTDSPIGPLRSKQGNQPRFAVIPGRTVT